MVEIQERVFQDYQSVLASVTVLYVLDQRGEEVKWFPVPSGGIRLLRPNYPNNCLTLDISEFEELKGKLIYTIMFHFGRSTFATEVDIFLEDREVALSRNYKFTKMDFIGPRITSGQTHIFTDLQDCSGSLERQLAKTYMVSFDQEIHTAKDKDRNCIDYPTKEFESFDDCDQQFLEELLKKEKLSPVWAFPPNQSARVTNLSISDKSRSQI